MAVKAVLVWLDGDGIFGEEFHFVFIILGFVEEMGCLNCFVQGGGDRSVVHVGPCHAGERRDVLLVLVGVSF